MLSPTPPSGAAEPAIESARAESFDRFGSRWWNQIKAWLGTPTRRRLAYAALQIPRIRWWEDEFSRFNDTEIRQKGLHLRGRARGGESLDRLLPEVFGLVCVASRRFVGLLPF